MIIFKGFQIVYKGTSSFDSSAFSSWDLRTNILKTARSHESNCIQAEKVVQAFLFPH
jgi:hypothetical protein